MVQETGCEGWGVEPSREMFDRARDGVPGATFVQGAAERLDVPDAHFDRVISVDVIHHVSDRDAYFAEVARVLRPDGLVCTVTDSPDDIRRRPPLPSHFPETVPLELARYPLPGTLDDEMRRAGLEPLDRRRVEKRSVLASSASYRDRAFSALHLLPEPVFLARLAQLEAELTAGPIETVAPYTLLWARAAYPRTPEWSQGRSHEIGPPSGTKRKSVAREGR
jgi:SAM-dependent methyltransferase